MLHPCRLDEAQNTDVVGVPVMVMVIDPGGQPPPAQAAQ